MTRAANVFWAIFALALLGAALTYGWNSITRGTDETAVATLVFTIIAAIAASLGAVETVRGNRSTSQQQKRMGDDISRLAELTESSIEETRALKPAPRLHFLVGEAGDAVDDARLVRRRIAREVAVDEILEDERKYLLSTMPPDESQVIAGEGFSSALSRMTAASMASSLYGGDPRSRFEGEVEEYLNRLRTWIHKATEWRDDISNLAVIDLQFDNRGRVPAKHVVAEITFPDPFKSWEEPPAYPKRPSRPKFSRDPWASEFGMLDRAISAPFNMPNIPLVGEAENVSTPRYRDGSVVVEIGVDKLLHGVPEPTLEPISLFAPSDGEFEVTWRLHAENMEEPAIGALLLTVETHLIDGPPIQTVGELQIALESGPDSGE